VSELTAEEIVKQKYPDAYCNNWLSKKGLRWWICTGVYEDMRSIGPKRCTPDEAWEAVRLTINAQRGKR